MISIKFGILNKPNSSFLEKNTIGGSSSDPKLVTYSSINKVWNSVYLRIGSCDTKMHIKNHGTSRKEKGSQ
jgi:hypothetical protein